MKNVTPRVDALMAQWDADGATRGAAFVELRDLARELELLAVSSRSILEAIRLEGFTLCMTENGYRLMKSAKIDVQAMKEATLTTQAPSQKQLDYTAHDAWWKEIKGDEFFDLTTRNQSAAAYAKGREDERAGASIDMASEEKHVVEGTVTFMRSDPEGQVCVCCPKGTGHIFSRGVKWDSYDTNRPEHFGNSANVFVDSRITDYNANEGRRVRLTVELLPTVLKRGYLGSTVDGGIDDH